jgi:DNA-binding NtrC family response regulator
MNTVLVVDDKEMMRDSVAATLQRAGMSVVTAENAEAALVTIASRRPDVVVSDMKMPGVSGLELLERIRQIDDELPVVMMTAFAAVDSAVRAIKLGAFDYITKPFEGDELVIAVKRAISHGHMLRENAVLKLGTQESGPTQADSPVGAKFGLDRIVGDSAAMRRVKEQVMAVAESQGTVLVCGESGSGKEVIARAIHEISPRRAAPFLAVNCAALSESLLESELFGHERGAFTGAERLRKGRFELADGGTLLLDEVSEVGAPTQAKLLRVLQERAFERVGSSLSIGVDVRLIATSNRDLPQAVARGDFRQDLFFRLNVLPIHVPPLRDRLEDVPALAEQFILQFCKREGRSPIRFDDDAMLLLQNYSWPGNVRELQNVCERTVVLSGASGGNGKHGARTVTRETIEPWLAMSAGAVVPRHTAAPLAAVSVAHPNGFVEPKMDGMAVGAPSLVRPLAELERDAIVQALRRFNGHRQKTARALGIGVRTLGLKLKKWKELKLVAESL